MPCRGGCRQRRVELERGGEGSLGGVGMNARRASVALAASSPRRRARTKRPFSRALRLGRGARAACEVPFRQPVRLRSGEAAAGGGLGLRAVQPAPGRDRNRVGAEGWWPGGPWERSMRGTGWEQPASASRRNNRSGREPAAVPTAEAAAPRPAGKCARLRADRVELERARNWPPSFAPWRDITIRAGSRLGPPVELRRAPDAASARQARVPESPSTRALAQPELDSGVLHHRVPQRALRLCESAALQSC